MDRIQCNSAVVWTRHTIQPRFNYTLITTAAVERNNKKFILKLNKWLTNSIIQTLHSIWVCCSSALTMDTSILLSDRLFLPTSNVNLLFFAKFTFETKFLSRYTLIRKISARYKVINRPADRSYEYFIHTAEPWSY